MKTVLFQLCVVAGVSIILPSPLVSAQTPDVKAVEERLLKQAAENIENYRKDDVVIRFTTKGGKALTNAAVEISQKTHDFYFGCYINDIIRQDTIRQEELYKQRFLNLFNLAIYVISWPQYESRQGMPAWENMLSVSRWCESHGITVVAHPLVWPCRQGVPQWMSGHSTLESEELVKAHVMNIVGGFKDHINKWIVVNEPVNVKTWEHKIEDFDDQTDWGVEDTIFDIAEYVDSSFQWAHTANPEAELILNEYNTIAVERVRERFYELVTALKSRGTPLSGLGIQAHEPREHWYPPEEVWKTFDLYAGLGYPIHITELHPQSSGKEITGGWRTGNWTEETQAEFTEQFVRLCFGHPAIASITWWGLSDRNIWLPFGGLVDEEYRPKPVYNRLNKLIHEEWNTSISGSLNSNGELAFRGFYGSYEITLQTADGKVRIFKVHLSKNEENNWEFNLDK